MIAKKQMENAELAKFCIEKVGVPYVMGTSGRVLTQAMYNDLAKRNPGGWFTLKRQPAVLSWIGRQATDCHGLVEWAIREQTGETYDTTADAAYDAATLKGAIGTIPEMPGVCVRYKGHVGVYIGGGYVVEARGFDYGTCITALKGRPWTHWYMHPKIKYDEKMLPVPSTKKIKKTSDRYSIAWLQLKLNAQIAAGYITGPALTVDGVYGSGTAKVTAAYWRKKGWTKENEVWGVGASTIKALQK